MLTAESSTIITLTNEEWALAVDMGRCRHVMTESDAGGVEDRIEPRGSQESIANAQNKGLTYCSGIKLSKSQYQTEADARHNIHKDQESSRPLSSDYELLGLVGEAQGEADFDVARDSRLLPEGDGRKDGKLHGYTVDWKVARKSYNLLMEAGKVHADIIVAGMWHEAGDECWVEWLGWEYRDELKKVKPADFGYGVINHYRAVDNLRPMEQFKSGNLSQPDGLTDHIQDAGARIAVAKLYGLRWDAAIDSYRPIPDLLGCEVRSANVKGPWLGIKKTDREKARWPFISVTHLGGRRYRIEGWIYGYDGMKKEFLGPIERHSGKLEWCIPFSRLEHPFKLRSTLWKLRDLKVIA